MQIKSLVVVICFLALAGCGAPLRTTKGVGEGGVCTDGDGGYQLPARDLKIELSRDKANPEREVQLATGLGDPAGDGRDIYCLKYRGAGTAADQIVLDIKEGLLQRVYSKNIDRSVAIAERLRDAVRDPNFGLRSQDLVIGLDNKSSLVNLDVNPFDRREMVLANAALRQHGYCLYLDPTNDPYVPRWSGTLCPLEGVATLSDVSLAPTLSGQGKVGTTGLSDVDLSNTDDVSLDRPVDGVLYRPNLTHDLVILRRRDPTGPGPWKLHEIKPVTMPNAAPILVAKIDRGTFVTRETELVFDDGVLVDAAVDKTSEVNAAVDLTIAVFETAFAIPVQILNIRANEAANRQQLIAANSRLLEATTAYRKALEEANGKDTDPDPEPDGGTDDGSRSQNTLNVDTAALNVECVNQIPPPLDVNETADIQQKRVEFCVLFARDCIEQNGQDSSATCLAEATARAREI